MFSKYEVYTDLPSKLTREYCIVGTPEWICDHLVSFIPIDSNATYLDPCVGRGPFLKSLLKAGVKPEQITACDIVKENIDYCRKVYKGIKYQVCDLMTIDTKYDYVVANPPWIRSLPKILYHLIFLAKKSSFIVTRFFHGNRAYKKLEPLVNRFLVDDFKMLINRGLAYSDHATGSCCSYEFKLDSPNGFSNELGEWIYENGLDDYFTFNPKFSVANNLALYSGQEFFLPINPLWYLKYIYNGFNIDTINKISILGSIRKDKKSYGLVYDSIDKLEFARNHYSSATVKKMLVCGEAFGWRHLKLV